jgi:hypothetical protein
VVLIKRVGHGIKSATARGRSKTSATQNG